MAIHERRRALFTGRKSVRQFLMLKGSMTESEEFGNLSAHATKLLIELARQYRGPGKNNGDLSAPWSKLRRRGWKSKSTLWSAIHELLDTGFIVQTRQGGKHHVCALYGITWEAIDDCQGKHHHAVETKASNLWRKTKEEVAMRTKEFAMRTTEPELAKKAA